MELTISPGNAVVTPTITIVCHPPVTPKVTGSLSGLCYVHLSVFLWLPCAQ